MLYCIKCGAKLADEAVFCHKCGTKVDSIVEKKGFERSQDYAKPEYYPPKATATQAQVEKPPYRRNKIPLILLGLVIAALIITPIGLMIGYGSYQFVYLDTYSYEVESLSVNNIYLDINNDIGDITIIYDKNASALFEATVTVQGRRGADQSMIREFEISESEDGIFVSFAAGEQNFCFLNKNIFEYDISIILHPSSVLNYSIYTATGDIELMLDSVNDIYIPYLDFRTATGHIWVLANEANSLTIDSVNIVGQTSSIIFDLANTQNATFSELYLGTTTGSIDVSLGEFTQLLTSYVNIYTTTGSVDVSYENILFTEDILWDISTTTGSINFNIVQNILTNVSLEATFYLSTTTGSIEVLYSIDADIGLKFDATTSTGSVTVPSDTTDYSSKLNRYFFNVEASTGSILIQEL
ncbi:MAG: zinc-ribbon domain-containing protein [Candidatus Heimdallarchaeaceae archaeon]